MMSRRDRAQPQPSGRAVALRYDGGNGAPVVVASGMGYLAEKIVEVASENGVPVYEDTSLATMLSQLSLGQEIPDSLYRAIVEIYVYFLEFDPSDPDKARRQREEAAAARKAAEEEAARQLAEEEAARQAEAAAQAQPAGAAEKGES